MTKSHPLDEPEILEAFRSFVRKETSWYVMWQNGEFSGKTAERYECFKAGYLAAKLIKGNANEA